MPFSLHFALFCLLCLLLNWRSPVVPVAIARHTIINIIIDIELFCVIWLGFAVACSVERRLWPYIDEAVTRQC